MVSRQPVLVTGAGGFVCSEIAVALAKGGHEVLATDAHFDVPTRERLTGITLLEGDLAGALAKSGVRPKTVIHGAAITAEPKKLGLSRAGHLRRNMDLLTVSLEFARTAGAERFVFLSSMGVFDIEDTMGAGNRVTEAIPAHGTCPYAAAKRAGEIVTQAAADDGFATLSLRLGSIFGPHEAVRETRQHLCLVGRMIDEARKTGIITVTTPEALREWAWLPDLAQRIARLATDLPEGLRPVLHAGTPPAITDLALARALAERISGTTIRLASPPHARIRPPMGTIEPDVMDRAPWTDLPGAFDRMLNGEVSA